MNIRAWGGAGRRANCTADARPLFTSLHGSGASRLELGHVWRTSWREYRKIFYWTAIIAKLIVVKLSHGTEQYPLHPCVGFGRDYAQNDELLSVGKFDMPGPRSCVTRAPSVAWVQPYAQFVFYLHDLTIRFPSAVRMTAPGTSKSRRSWAAARLQLSRKLFHERTTAYGP